MADIDISGRAPGTAVVDAGEKPHQFGLTQAMALIVGSIIGVGIFNLPTSLAVYGPITPRSASSRPPSWRRSP
jgi:hypothetical protein